MKNLIEKIKSEEWKLNNIEDSFILEKIYSSTLSEDVLALLKYLIREKNYSNIFEFGGGLSTVLISKELNLKEKSYRFISIDDSEEFLLKTKNNVEKLVPNSTTKLLHAPLEDLLINNTSYISYSNKVINQAIKEIDTLNLVIIDGPMGWKYGRTAPLFEILSKVNSNTLVLLDDARRNYEQKDIQNWKDFLGNNIQIEYIDTFNKGLAIVSFRDFNVKVKHSLLNKNKFDIKIL